MFTRRKMIQATFGSAALITAGTAAPPFLWGASRQASQKSDEKILVVIQLSGGNDGLNTVIPYANDEYYRNRFTLAVEKSQVVKIDDEIGWHPALNGFARLLDDGQLAVVQGVGYPNPNRSHFESMDLWHTAHQNTKEFPRGWLGRCVDEHLSGELPAIHYGGEKQPLALTTRTKPVASIQSLDQFRLRLGEHRPLSLGIAKNLEQQREHRHELLGFIHENASMAMTTSQKLESILSTGDAMKTYPETTLGKKLAAVAQLIESGLPTRIYYVTHDGFDTHANQAAAHAALLQQLGDATQAFHEDLKNKGHAERTLLMTFSEFGRRVRENASRGTDHGTAAPLFLAGGRLKAGPLNQHPDLLDLEQGDLKHNIDYRSVYATVLEDWLGVESTEILGQPFKKLNLFI